MDLTQLPEGSHSGTYGIGVGMIKSTYDLFIVSVRLSAMLLSIIKNLADTFKGVESWQCWSVCSRRRYLKIVKLIQLILFVLAAASAAQVCLNKSRQRGKYP